jgi:acid stress chaperone HdeB
MKRPLQSGAVLLFVAVFAAGGFARPSRADQIDLSTWTCKRFQTATPDEIYAIVAWLDGYYKEEDDSPIVDFDDFVGNAKKLGSFCAAHPDVTLIKAADEIFLKE